MKGLLIDGPAQGMVVQAGDPPIRRAIVILGRDGFAEDAYRYYLNSTDSTEARYRFGGQVLWPPEASSEAISRTDQREHVADQASRGASQNGD
jgi:hypothetical protein